MSVLVVGSVAYDSVVTPTGSRSEALGGSATYFCVAGSYFAPVSVVAVVGQDFRSEDLAMIKQRGVDTTGIAREQGKSFRWSGKYGEEDLNARTTLDTQLNVFAEFSPRLSADHKRAPYVFLANIDPELQRDVLSQVSTQPMLVALDTMNFWIGGKNDQLRDVVRDIDVLFMDESEARQFAGHANLVKAAREIMDLGPTVVVLKRGQHGVLLFQPGSVFAAPAFPLEDVVDPTGAGDAFAGGFIGYLAATGDLNPGGFRRATVLGSVMGSFAVESFSLDRLASLSKEGIDARFRAFAELSQFDALREGESLPWRDAS